MAGDPQGSPRRRRRNKGISAKASVLHPGWMNMWNAEQKLKRLQAMVGRGIFIEDPGGLLWMSDRARGLVDALDANEEIKTLMKEKAKDDDDYKTGFWTCIYAQYVEEFTTPEIGEAVAIFKGWEKAIAEDRLREWSMGLRLR